MESLTVKAYLRKDSATIRWNGLICAEARGKGFLYKNKPEIELLVSNTDTQVKIIPIEKNYFHIDNDISVEDKSIKFPIRPLLIDIENLVCFGAKEEITNYGTSSEKNSLSGGIIFLCFVENGRNSFIELVPHDRTPISPKQADLQRVLPGKYIMGSNLTPEQLVPFQELLKRVEE